MIKLTDDCVFVKGLMKLNVILNTEKYWYRINGL